MTTIGQVRVPDESDPNANIIWGPAHAVASAPRPFTFMLGLTGRNWPRQGREDGLFPSHILDTALLEPTSVTLEDRTHFAVLRDAANQIVCSRSRRDSEGRLLGTSPLALSELASQHLQGSRIPEHAFSESAASASSAIPARKSIRAHQTRRSLLRRRDFASPEALHRMVVHHANGLHKCVADGRSHKIEPALLQRFTHSIGLRGARWNLTP